MRAWMPLIAVLPGSRCRRPRPTRPRPTPTGRLPTSRSSTRSGRKNADALPDQHPPVHAGGHLPGGREAAARLKDLGVDILWLMPIHPIGEKNRKGSLGSPYSVKDYYSVNPEFGTLEDLKHFVSAAHELGMHVILDWVANHTAWDNILVDEHPGVVRPRLEGRLPPDAVVGLVRHHRPRLQPRGTAPVHDRGHEVLGEGGRHRRLPLRRGGLRARRLLEQRAPGARRDQAGLHAGGMGVARPARRGLRRDLRLELVRRRPPDRHGQDDGPERPASSTTPGTRRRSRATACA